MKHYKWIHHHINNTRTQQITPKLSVLILLAGMLLSLPFIGCAKAEIFGSGSEYKAPELPKSELATIKVDTEEQWLQRPNLIVFRIDGKLALREKIKAFEEVSFEEILVAPGKHEMSVLVVYESFHANTPRDRQILSRFSADVKAGGTYLLTGEFSGGGSSELNFYSELIDTSKDRVVSEAKLFDQFSFELE